MFEIVWLILSTVIGYHAFATHEFFWGWVWVVIVVLNAGVIYARQK